MGFLDTLLFREPARRDWIFIGFVGITVLASSWTGMSRFRYGRAASRFAQCAADADADCAAPQLETLRAIDAEARRTTLADAQMAVLGGDGSAGLARLRRIVLRPSAFSGRPSLSLVQRDGDVDPAAVEMLDADERGAALLAVGDIAALRGDVTLANARWTEAAGVVDDSLIEPRRRRLATQKDLRDAKLSDAMSALKGEFDKLFDSARSGSDGTAYSASALRTRVATVQPALAAKKLSLAIDASDRCARLVRARGISQNAPVTGTWTQPQPPIPPTDAQVARQPWLRDHYKQEQQRYEQALARWQAQQDDRDKRRNFAEDESTRTANNVMEEARNLRDEGLALASSVPQ